MDRTGRHPDWYSDEEAAFYMNLEGPRSLDLVIADFGLKFHKFGRRRVFYRSDLDTCLMRMAGMDKESQPRQRGTNLRIAGGEA